MNNKKQLLLFDLDDTLLNSQKIISKANVLAIKKCKTKGMVIGYITARSPRKVKTYLKDLPCDCLAYYNGASITAGDILLEKNEIPYSEGIKTMSEIQNVYTDISIGVYLEPYSYFNGQIKNIFTQEIYSGTIENLPVCDIQRIRIVMEAHRDILLDKYITKDMKCIYSIYNTAIITNKRATKENALYKFGEFFNIDVSKIIAFGDDTNDIGMIKAAGTGVAMGNSIDEVKSSADFVCDTNDNDGVAMWINKFLL